MIDSTSERAVKIACSQVGISSRSVKIFEHLCAEPFVPFISKPFIGTKLWQINFSDISEVRKNPQLASIPYISNLSALVSPVTGNVLKVFSHWATGVPAIAPYPSVAEEEIQLRAMRESFSGFPVTPPALYLMRVLKIIEAFGVGGVREAKQIIAYHVLQTTRSYTDRQVWIVQVRGIHPPSDQRDFLIPIDARNHLRHVIDAQSGKWLFADTAPQPKLTDPSRSMVAR